MQKSTDLIFTWTFIRTELLPLLAPCYQGLAYPKNHGSLVFPSRSGVPAVALCLGLVAMLVPFHLKLLKPHVRKSVYLSIYLSIYLPTYVSIYPSIYCGWKKSEASWPLAFLIIYRVSTIQGGGGFLPSTESTYLPIYLSTYLRIYLSVYQSYLIPVVPHKAVGEVSKIGNL